MEVSVGRPAISRKAWRCISDISSVRWVEQWSGYKSMEGDAARQDDEQLRWRVVSGDRVSITNLTTGKPIHPLGQVQFKTKIETNYYVLCFSTSSDPEMYDLFTDTDSCLIVHHPEVFCERVHSVAAERLPKWSGIDAKATYGFKGPLGALFEKDFKYIGLQEWRFASLPSNAQAALQPMDIEIGSIEDIAELVLRKRG